MITLVTREPDHQAEALAAMRKAIAASCPAERQDDDAIQGVLEDALIEAGFVVALATAGHEALIPNKPDPLQWWALWIKGRCSNSHKPSGTSPTALFTSPGNTR